MGQPADAKKLKIALDYSFWFSWCGC